MLKLIKRFKSPDRYQRIWIAIAGLWVLISNFFYFKEMYFVYCWSQENDFPPFYSFWMHFTFPLYTDFFPYSVKEFPNLEKDACSIFTYSLMGHLYLVFMPCLLMLIGYFVNEWIRKGNSR